MRTPSREQTRAWARAGGPALLGVAVLSLVAGCGRSTAKPPAATSHPPAATSQPPAATQSCSPASAKLLADIARKAVPDAQVVMTRGEVWKSPTAVTPTYFVAADFGVAIGGVDHETGVWATDDQQRPTKVVAVDYWAQQVTTWPSAAGSGGSITATDPGVAASEKCLATTS